MISIIVPTIQGREHWLDGCREAYRRMTKHVEYEFIVLHDYPTCGEAWNQGIRQSKGNWIHLSADDIEPTPGWWQVGTAWLHRKILPAPRILNSDRTLQSCGDTADETPDGTPTDLQRVPFFPRSLLPAIYPIIEVHYATDYWVTHQARKVGWPTLVVRDFCFIHHYAPEGRVDERLASDWAAFKRAAH
jgi:hypothetical protein